MCESAFSFKRISAWRYIKSAAAHLGYCTKPLRGTNQADVQLILPEIHQSSTSPSLGKRRCGTMESLLAPNSIRQRSFP